MLPVVTLFYQRFCKYTVRLLLFIFRKLGIFQNKTELYFAYGANLGPDRYEENDIPYLDEGNAQKAGHEINFTLPCHYVGKGYANIQKVEWERSPKYAYGRLYRISRLGLLYLDIIERVPSNYYRRDNIKFEGQRLGQVVEAWCYVACHPKENLVPPTSYLDYMREKSKDYNFPEVYQDYLSKIKAKEHFEIDHNFCFSNPAKKRPFVEKWPQFYRAHDLVREFFIKILP